jgi:hypothetical protein
MIDDDDDCGEIGGMRIGSGNRSTRRKPAPVPPPPFLNWYRGGGGGVQSGPLGTAAINRPIVPAPGDYDDGEIGGMIGRGNRSTRREPAPVPLCPPETPHAAWTRTRAAAVGSQQLTAWATSATLFTTNPTWPGSGSNPGRRGGKPTSNRLSYGTARGLYFVMLWNMCENNMCIFCGHWRN